jgi:NAD(P)-dependent dehydrogenase (short-subunit alcohol dehydrogenase family)
MSFENKVVLVTGGSSGIGLAIAKVFSDQGANLVITGRKQDRLDEAVSVLGANVVAIKADVADLSELAGLFEQVKSLHGRIDILVANAGVGQISPLGSITEEGFDLVFNTNVKGVTFTVQGALPLMSQGGSVVIIGSTASMNPGGGLSVYGATKAALRSLVRSWILDIKGSGVRINILSPGPVDTDSLRNMLGADADSILGFLNDKSTLGRIGQADEIGKAVAFLAGTDSSYINGVELFADGGASQV